MSEITAEKIRKDKETKSDQDTETEIKKINERLRSLSRYEEKDLAK